MEYRMADASDIDMLMNVRLSMLRIVNDLPADYIFDDELVVSSRRYFLEGDQTTVVAVNDGRCVACASMSYIEIMPTFSHSSGKRAHLMNVYTEEHYRRRGIARQLVNMLIEDARVHGATEISLDATESGRPLYESMAIWNHEDWQLFGLDKYHTLPTHGYALDNIRFTYIYLRRQTEADIAMEVRDSIEKRRSIRKFKNTPVEQKE